MTEFDVFKYGILSIAGLIILGLIWACIHDTARMLTEEEFLDRAARSPKQDVRAWIAQHEEEFDFVPYTVTALYVHIKGDLAAKSFTYSKLEPACEKLVRAGIAIEDPTSVVARVRQKMMSSPSKRSRARNRERAQGR
jgi:hypothetical protein